MGPHCPSPLPRGAGGSESSHARLGVRHAPRRIETRRDRSSHRRCTVARGIRVVLLKPVHPSSEARASVLNTCWCHGACAYPGGQTALSRRWVASQICVHRIARQELEAPPPHQTWCQRTLTRRWSGTLSTTGSLTVATTISLLLLPFRLSRFLAGQRVTSL